MSIWRWAEWMEPAPPTVQVTLGEGNTPLVRSRKIGPEAGLERLCFSFQGPELGGSHARRCDAPHNRVVFA